ncbi:DNA-binding transcriptional LysR family regulator [Streptosporangium album]|uniref:DNA-binding transcriptional LysR family regulator n=1 Tax=Streptosporangium album TaxID=47479 RepID=A0A7W7RTW2_9ACTN|nr:LysR family transcriptional regulator [Streptosporangium album]MBB4938119.1 DNA-binding transcriptional LysR family regulator [Streptosporangium album]
MEFRQLEYFVAVAEECHFTRAAKRLRVAQSGLSASIRSLERELGASLFLRSTRQVELTPAGRALLAEARRALSATNAAKDAVAAVQGLLRGSLAIGSLQCLHVVHLPAVLARFLAAHPGLEIRLRQGGSGELIEQVRAGRLDLAFVSRPARCPDDVVIESLADEPLVLACAPEHPFAAREQVGLVELAAEQFVDFPPDWGTRDLVDDVLATAGVERRVALEVTDVHSLLDLVTFGLGVALVPQSFSVKTDRVRFVGLAGAVPVWETVTVTGDPTSAAAAALLREVHEARSGRRSAATSG